MQYGSQTARGRLQNDGVTVEYRMMTSKALSVVAALGSVLLSACGDGSSFGGGSLRADSWTDSIEMPTGSKWASAWGGTRTTGTAPADATIRNITRVTASGPAIRLRFFNLGTAPRTIGKASVGIRE